MSDDIAQRFEESVDYILKIKYKGTDHNKMVVKLFQEFCYKETDNGYLLGIEKMLNAYLTDWKYESLYAEIVALKELVAKQQELLEKQNESPKKDKMKTFGA